MWIERTTYITAYHFPGILKWFEVKSVSVVRSTLDAQTLFDSVYIVYFPFNIPLIHIIRHVSLLMLRRRLVLWRTQ